MKSVRYDWGRAAFCLSTLFVLAVAAWALFIGIGYGAWVVIRAALSLV